MNHVPPTLPGFTKPAFEKPATAEDFALQHWLNKPAPRVGLIPGQPVCCNHDGVAFAYLDLIRMRDPDSADVVWTLTVKRVMSWSAECGVCFEVIPTSHLCASGPDVYVCLDCVLPIERYRYAPLGLKS